MYKRQALINAVLHVIRAEDTPPPPAYGGSGTGLGDTAEAGSEARP